MKHGEGNTNLPELLLLNFLPLTYHYSHFLAAILDFTSFFTTAFLGATYFLYSWAVFGLDYSLSLICYSIPVLPYFTLKVTSNILYYILHIL